VVTPPTMSRAALVAAALLLPATPLRAAIAPTRTPAAPHPAMRAMVAQADAAPTRATEVPAPASGSLVGATADECSAIESRVADLAGRWLASLPVPARAKAVAELLRDEVAAVRLAAVTEIERLLRDGIRPDASLSDATAAMLSDADPRVRARVGALVVDMGLPFAGDGLAARLEYEREDLVIDAWLDAMLEAPSAAAFAPSSARIPDAVHGERAARVIAELVRLGSAPIDWKKRLAPTLRVVADGRATPSVALLVAQLGEDQDIARAERLLESADPAVRRGAAEGFLRIGDHARVLARASDPAIAGVVIAAIARERPNLAGLRELIAFPISGELRGQLHDLLCEVAARLSPEDLLAADDAMSGGPAAGAEAIDAAGAQAIDARVRLRVFEAGARRFSGAEKATTARLVERLALQMIALERRSDAVVRLENARPAEGGALADALFTARLCAGRFDDAARQDPNPARWVAVAESLARTGDSSARALVDEMKLRFGARLGDDERRRLASVEGVLSAAPARGN